LVELHGERRTVLAVVRRNHPRIRLKDLAAYLVFQRRAVLLAVEPFPRIKERALLFKLFGDLWQQE
jgi:hypothetical protein